MADITQRTIAELIDQLITTNLRCWTAQDQVRTAPTVEERAEAGAVAQTTNALRNQLIRAINERLGEADNSPLPKTYA